MVCVRAWVRTRDKVTGRSFYEEEGGRGRRKRKKGRKRRKRRERRERKKEEEEEEWCDIVKRFQAC